METTKEIIKTTIIVFLLAIPQTIFSQTLKENPELDKKVLTFLQENRHMWYDMNVPEMDGHLLFDIITKNGYKNALEIGTSTGHSGIWIAWALSKTGGCFTAHNISERQSGYRSGQGDFLKYIRSLDNYSTEVNSLGGGVSISYKK